MTPDGTTPPILTAAPALPTGGVGSGAVSAAFAAARRAAAAWQAGRRQPRRPCLMAPWDEALFCLNPYSHVEVLGAVPDQVVVAANPSRVVLIFSVQAAVSGDAYINPSNPTDPNTPLGIHLTSGMLPFVVRQADYLNLASVEWHGTSPAAGVRLAVIEVILRDWPRG